MEKLDVRRWHVRAARSGDDYKVWVNVPGYYSSGRAISLRDGARRNLRVPLTRETPYPCDFTVVNKTGWRITLYFDDGGPRDYVFPWSSTSFTLRGPVGISPSAEFSNRPPMKWGIVAASCDGAAYVNLLP